LPSFIPFPFGLTTPDFKKLSFFPFSFKNSFFSGPILKNYWHAIPQYFPLVLF